MKRIKFFFSLLVMLSFAIGNVWATDVTIQLSDALWSTTAGQQSGTKDGITISTSSGLINATDYRVYKNYTLTVSSTVGNITNIALTYTNASNDGGGWATSYQPNTTSWTSPTANGEQARITKIVVTYSGGSTETAV